MEKHVLLHCTKGKDVCTSYKEVIEMENLSFGRRERKRAYPSSQDGSSYKEMTEHKHPMQPSMINNERKSLEALNQYKSIIKIEIHLPAFHFEIHFKNPLKAMYKAGHRYNYGKTNHLSKKNSLQTIRDIFPLNSCSFNKYAMKCKLYDYSKDFS